MRRKMRKCAVKNGGDEEERRNSVKKCEAAIGWILHQNSPRLGRLDFHRAGGRERQKGCRHVEYGGFPHNNSPKHRL